MVTAWDWGRKDGLWYPGTELQFSKVLGSGESSPSLKCIPCESGKLSCVPRNLGKESQICRHSLGFPALGRQEKWILWAPWPGSLAYSISFRPIIDPAPIKR